MQCDAEFAGLAEDFFFFENKHVTRLKCGVPDAALGHAFECAQAKTGHVEPVVLRGLDCFDEKRRARTRAGAAAEHFVRSFKSFDGDGRGATDDDALSDVEPGDFLCNAHPVVEGRGGDSGGAPACGGHVARSGELVIEKSTGVERCASRPGDFVGEGAEDGACIFFP